MSKVALNIIMVLVAAAMLVGAALTGCQQKPQSDSPDKTPDYSVSNRIKRSKDANDPGTDATGAAGADGLRLAVAGRSLSVPLTPAYVDVAIGLLTTIRSELVARGALDPHAAVAGSGGTATSAPVDTPEGAPKSG